MQSVHVLCNCLSSLALGVGVLPRKGCFSRVWCLASCRWAVHVTVMCVPCAEVQSIVGCLRALLNEEEDPTDMSDVALIMDSKSGCKRLVAQLITQSSYLNQRELTLRKSLQAWSCYGAEVLEAEKSMQSEPAEALKGLVDKLTLWKKAIRSGGLLLRA